MPNPDSSVLDKVIALNACMTLDPSTVRQILEVTLTVDEEQSNRFFTIHTGRAQDPGRSQIASVELRVSKAGQKSKGEFLFFKLTEDSRLTGDEVAQRFGPPPKVDVPTPENSPEYSVRYLYRFNGRPVNFALATGPSGRVVSVAFDRTE